MLLRSFAVRRLRLRRRLTRDDRLPDIRYVSTSTLNYLRRTLPPDQLHVAYVPVDSAQRFAPPPANTLGVSRLTARDHSTYREMSVLRLDSARILGEVGHILTRDGTLLADGSFENPATFYGSGLWRTLVTPHEPAQRLAGNTCVLGSLWSGINYFHFLFELLPRVEMVCRSGIALGEVNQFVVNPLKFEVFWEALTQSGIARDRVLVSSPSAAFEVQHLIAPSSLQGTGHMRKWVCDWLNQTFTPCPDASRQSLRVFVGRSDANRRHLDNQAEIWEQVLLPLGFQIVRWDGQSIRSQAALFASAEVVVGVNGAALTNLVFCRPGTRVVVIHHPAYLSRWFYELAATRGLDYYYVVGEPTPHTARRWNGDYAVNPSTLAALLKQANVN